MAVRPRGGFSAEDLDASFGERRFVALDGYEDDIEQMAKGYVPDYNTEFDPERASSSGGRDVQTKAPVATSEVQTTRTQPKSQVPPPLASPVMETASEATQGPAPSWTDEYSGTTDSQKDDADDEGEPICPLSMFSSIAEANVTPVKQKEPAKPSWNPPPRPDSQQRQSQAQSSPKPPHPTQQRIEEKTNEKPKPRMAPKPRTSSNRASSSTGSWNPHKNISREEFRAKYAFVEDDEETLGFSRNTNVEIPTPVRSESSSPRRQAAPSTQSRERQIPGELSSSREDDEIVQSKLRLTQLEGEIFTMNGSKLNLKSHKQVSQALFGDPNQSTARDVLEGVAGSNILAKLVLEYRQLSQTVSKLEKRKITRVKRVKSVVGEATASSEATSEEEDTGEESPSNSSRLLLLDTSSFIFRAYYSMPPIHRSTDGTPVGAVLGFCNMLNRLLLNSMLQGIRPYLVLCKDAGGPTFRNEMYEEYKANRKEAPMDLIPQFDLIYEAAEAYGLVQISAPGYEADDIIATLCKQATEQNMGVDILSGDKDLMQLITNSTANGGSVTMINPMTMNRMTHDTVLEKWGVPAHMLSDLLALAGDSADNIPGVPGIGPKIAAQMLQEFGSLEDLLQNSDQVKQNKRRESLQEHEDMARLSKDLVTLVSNVPSERMICIPEQASSLNIEDFRMQPMDANRILEFYDSMRFFTIKQRLLKRLEDQKKVTYQKKQHPQQQQKKKKTFSRKPKKVEPPKPEDYQDVPF